MTEPTPPEEQPDLFPDSPMISSPKASVFDPMNAPGEPQFPGWGPDGENTFHGPPSD